MLTTSQARRMAQDRAPAGYRLHTLARVRADRFTALYVDERFRSRRGEVTEAGAAVHRTVYGPKYRRSDGERETQVAARIRADYRQARTRGVIPEDLRVSVRSGRGRGIVVEVSGLSDRFLNEDRRGGEQYGARAAGLLRVLEEIREAYQRDGTDSASDLFQLRYAGYVVLLSEAQQRQRAEERAQGRPPGPRVAG
ncbi:hypothetical protein [Streptomyces sp. NRRL B-24484]|uniref:hypothetical protein n=1 Tax=Streptomyces sp. NRRL B-24484 TaxID=1463833 RepID=UPI0004BE8E8B|nr:hypothetical protein [Streptomyces sp. NRRL B-24484]